jgi:hypothetical protein
MGVSVSAHRIARRLIKRVRIRKPEDRNYRHELLQLTMSAAGSPQSAERLETISPIAGEQRAMLAAIIARAERRLNDQHASREQERAA